VTDSPRPPNIKVVSNATPMSAQAVETEPLDFRAVYQAQFAYVWRSLRRLGVRERDLEDVAHDVFVAFYRGSDGYDRARPIRPWLFGICFRVASDYRRRAQHRFEVPSEAEEVADGGPDADARVASREARRLVLWALEALDFDRRAVFVMHDLDGYSMPEIAATLSAPLNTLYSRLRLAREQFAIAVRRRARRER